MFGSHNAYGYNNSYGNSPYYAPPSTNDSFWPNNNNNVNNKPNRPNYRNPEPSVASDSLYGYQDNNYPEQNIDGSVKHIESGLSGLSIDSSKHLDDYASIIPSRKTISWASVASQPAKSQPKSLKSKMASGLTGSTSKHLPPSVTMDAISWDSKNGNSSSGGKTMPPPAVIPAASIPPPIVPPTASPIEELPPPVMQPPHAPMPRQPTQSNKENSWGSTGNSSSSGSVSTSASSPRPSQTPVLPRTNNNRCPVYENNENYNPNKYSNPRSNYSKPIDNRVDNQPYVPRAPVHQPPPPREVINSVPHPPPSVSPDEPAALVVDKLIVENDYNPKELDLATRNARFFIIKSYSEDDIHRSIKYSIWCSTEHGNKRLDNAFRQQEDKGPIYLFFSVNRSGHFCGIAQMMSHVDYNCSSGVWSQDKWKGQFQVKWVYVKDVPNDELRHITLENNENKPVTNSRDTQEVPYEKGLSVLAIIHKFDHRTSIFDDFLHYEKKQEEELQKRPETPPVQQLPNNNFNKMPVSNSHYNSSVVGGDRLPREQNQVPFRGNNYNRSYPDGRDPRNDYRNEYRNDHYRNDYRTERPDYPNRNDNYRERNMEPRNDYRDNREYRDYREHREPQYHRDYPPRDFHPPQPRGPPQDYPRERNDYRPVERDYRERVEHRDRNHERHQSWRN